MSTTETKWKLNRWIPNVFHCISVDHCCCCRYSVVVVCFSPHRHWLRFIHHMHTHKCLTVDIFCDVCMWHIRVTHTIRYSSERKSRSILCVWFSIWVNSPAKNSKQNSQASRSCMCFVVFFSFFPSVYLWSDKAELSTKHGSVDRKSRRLLFGLFVSENLRHLCLIIENGTKTWPFRMVWRVCISVYAVCAPR